MSAEQLYRIRVAPGRSPDKGLWDWSVELVNRYDDAEMDDVVRAVASGTSDNKQYARENGRQAVERDKAHEPEVVYID